jgi:hypothetical protein
LTQKNIKASLNRFLKKPINAVIVIPVVLLIIGIAFSSAYSYGQQVQYERDQQQLREFLASNFEHVNCTVAAIYDRQFTSNGESVTVVNNPDGTCSLQFNVGFTVTMNLSARFSASIACPASYHEALMLTTAAHTSFVYNSQTIPKLVLTWTDCSSQDIQFALDSSPLTVFSNAYGNTSATSGRLCSSYCGDSCPAAQCTFDVSAHNQTTFTLPIVSNSPIGPTAKILHINGNITAIDPASMQAISAPETFVG